MFWEDGQKQKYYGRGHVNVLAVSFTTRGQRQQTPDRRMWSADAAALSVDGWQPTEESMMMMMMMMMMVAVVVTFVRCTLRCRRHWWRWRDAPGASRLTGWDAVCTGLRSSTNVIGWTPSWSTTFIAIQTHPRVSFFCVRRPSCSAPYKSTQVAGS